MYDLDAWGFRNRVNGLGFRAQGVGLRGQGLGMRVRLISIDSTPV